MPARAGIRQRWWIAASMAVALAAVGYALMRYDPLPRFDGYSLPPSRSAAPSRPRHLAITIDTAPGIRGVADDVPGGRLRRHVRRRPAFERRYATMAPRSDTGSSVRRALSPEIRTDIPVSPEPEDAGAETRMLHELQLGRLVRRVIPTFERNRVVMVPLKALLQLAEIEYEETDGVIRGEWPRGTRFFLDAAAHRVRVGARALEVAAADLTLIAGEPRGSLAFLGEVFGLTAVLDQETAAIFVHNPDELPVAHRLRREMARAIVLEPGITQPAVRRLTEYGAGDGGVITYDLRTISDRFDATTAYDVGFATGVGPGAITTRLYSTGDAAPIVDGAWVGRWPWQRWLTQLRIGDGWLTGPRPEASRGIAITNASFARPILVEDMPFAGDLPPDWTVEAYRAGRLIGFDSVGQSGRYELTLPVQYGENPVDFIAYSPTGETSTFHRAFRALPLMLPAGAFEYGLSVGSCRLMGCGTDQNLDLRYGLSRRWTVRGGVSRRPYAGVVGAPLNGLSLELEGMMQEYGRAGVRLDPSAAVRIATDYTRYDDGRAQWSADGRISSSANSARLVFEFDARRVWSTAVRTDFRTGIALRAMNVMARPYVRFERLEYAGISNHAGYLGLDATILPRHALGPVLGGIWAQGKVEVNEHRRPVFASLTLARNLDRVIRLEGGMRWEKYTPGPALTFSVVSQLSAVRSTSLVTALAAEDYTRLEQSVGGSVIWRRGGDFTLSSEPVADRGGIAGVVFLDLNADGRRQRDEPKLPDTRILVANQWRTTDREGRYRIWGLSPFEESVVTLDTTSLASPWWSPGIGSLAVLPAPSGYRTLDLPVVVGGVIEGSVAVDTGVVLRRTPMLVLIAAATGERLPVETFSDGAFYRMGMPPGHYRLTVDAAELADMTLVADTVSLTISAPTGVRGSLQQLSGTSVTGLRVGIHPRRRPRNSGE